MRKFILLAAILFACLGGIVESDASGVTDALPAHARLVAMEAIPGLGSAYAVAFNAGPTEIGIVRVEPGGDVLSWSHILPLPVKSLSTPGPDGLFGGVGKDTRSGAGEFFAYRSRGSGAVSAIDQHAAGVIVGSKGLRVVHKGFVVRKPYLKEHGSVRYVQVSKFVLKGRRYVRLFRYRVPDYAPGMLPRPSALVKNQNGDTILIRLEIASTEQQRETGLMFRRQLDPNTGMIFVWSQPILESFWMENTYIPLSVAFLSASGKIQETQDMAPLTTTLHTPEAAYLYAVEVNQGYFADNDINPGDRMQLNLGS